VLSKPDIDIFPTQTTTTTKLRLLFLMDLGTLKKIFSGLVLPLQCQWPMGY
jgi:hypothetical protein